MTLNRIIFESTRPFLLASATGAALCSMTLIAQAQNAAPGGLPPLPESASEPQLLPVAAPTLQSPEDSGHPVSLAGGPVPQGQTYQTQYQTPNQQPPINMQESSQDEVDSARGTRSRPILDRISRLFKKEDTGTRPVDPGMNYPKASDVAAGPPQAPGASQSVIPSIPPSVSVTQPQPGLFQPSVSANPIDRLVPPEPNPDLQTASQTLSPVAGTQDLPLRNIPELKALMTIDESASGTAEETQQAPPPEVVQEQSLPTLEFNAPIPGPAPKPAPGEPSGTMTAQTPPAPAATTSEAASAESSDPFADLFPADAQQTAQAQTKPQPEPQSEETPVTEPYTGLTLEMDSGKPTPTDLPSLPAESEIPALATTPEAEPKSEPKPIDLPSLPAETEIPALATTPKAEPKPIPPLKTAAASPNMDLPPTPKQTPESGQTVPNDPPQLSSTSSPQIEIKPLEQKKQKPTTPPQSHPDDPESKLKLIASRTGLTGLKGFCPVVLRDQRDLVDSSPEYTVTFNGREYALSSREAKVKFLLEPTKYAPAASCCDVIHLALTGERLEGSLEHAVWYKGRLYLFAGVETMETFVAAPSSHATDE